MRLEYKWRAAIVVAIGLFMAILDNTVVNVALPQMASAFHTDLDTIKWVSTAYFLAQAAVIPVTGYVSDRIGTKTVFLTALALFTVGSALCALAPNEKYLIAFRVLQGVGGGALFPIAFAITFRVFPPTERGPASAIIGVPVLLAPAFGPTIGGYLTTTFNWNAIFTVNIPIGVVALILGSLVLHDRRAEQALGDVPEVRGKRFDILGLILSMAGVTALVYGISHAGDRSGASTIGWTDTTVLAFLIAGGVMLLAFVVVELFVVSDPVMDLRLFRNYTFTIANVLMWSISALLFGSLLLIPFFFESVQHQTALSTGEILISQGLAAALATVIAGRFYNVIGPRIMAVFGFAMITAGTYGLTQFSATTTGADLQVWLVLRGIGLGFTNIPMQTLAVSVVSNRAMARASSLINVTRQIAGALGITILTTYLLQQATSHAASVTSSFLASSAGQHAQAACAAKLAPNVAAIQSCVRAAATPYVASHAFVIGLNDTFLVTTIATGACTILALFVGRDPAIEAAKRAAASGETVSGRPAIMGE
jgi:EmrB/QacA subfamily drug resistance transporter